jgi:microcystin-dependent protein
MATPFIAQVTLFPFNFAPKGWATCSGQLLPISQNTALFSLIGTFYGGDGRSTFALPDLRGRVPNGMGQGPGLSPYDIGEVAGAESVTVLVSQLPAHSHALQATSAAGTTNSPSNALLAQGVGGSSRGRFTVNTYASSGTSATLTPLPPVGGNLPHNNMQPSWVLNWCIALQGIFPARS